MGNIGRGIISMKIEDTRIQIGGVYRCCLESVAADLKEVEIGDKAECEHCKQGFTLIDGAGKYPKWVPDWQLKGGDSESQ